MSITDEDLAKELHAACCLDTGYGIPWEEISVESQRIYIAEARTARRLLCPPSPEDLRMERGNAAREAWLRGADASENLSERWCQAADAAIAKKAEQDAEAGR